MVMGLLGCGEVAETAAGCGDRRWTSLSVGAVASEGVGEPLGGIVRDGVGRNALAGSADRIQHRGVVATSELAPDRWKTGVRQLPRQEHRQLAWPRHPSRAAGRDQLLQREAEDLAGAFLDLTHRP